MVPFVFPVLSADVWHCAALFSFVTLCTVIHPQFHGGIKFPLWDSLNSIQVSIKYLTFFHGAKPFPPQGETGEWGQPLPRPAPSENVSLTVCQHYRVR
jgi:hypothetical protein